MNKERLNLSLEQEQKIFNLLQSQGISQSEIEQIINGSYEGYDSKYDLEESFGGLKKHGDVLEKLSEGYSMDELQSQGISQTKIEEFNKMLTNKNLTVDNAKAIYQYSVGSNMILGVKRGTAKETIQQQIMSDLEESLRTRGVEESSIEQMKELVKSVDYADTPLHSNYDVANRYMEEMGIQSNCRVSVRSAMQSMDRCSHIEETISSLEEGLGSTQLPKSMKLYRAVKSEYLQRRLLEGQDLSSLVGKSISNNGQTSTSPLYDSSFASLEDYDTVFEIYAPQGSRGSYIAELSAYDTTEQEVLLNPNDLLITDVQTGVIDKNGKTKNVLQALCLSKDRECYKEVEQQRKETQSIKPSEAAQVQSEEHTSSFNNLPARQNRFSKFFNQFRSRFTKDRDSIKQHTSQDRKVKIQGNQEKKTEKKSWELEPEEKTRIQKESVEIAKRHREQQENQKQFPQQEVGHNQENIQQTQQVVQEGQQINQQQQVPVQQQPIMDMGGMEL